MFDLKCQCSLTGVRAALLQSPTPTVNYSLTSGFTRATCWENHLLTGSLAQNEETGVQRVFADMPLGYGKACGRFLTLSVGALTSDLAPAPAFETPPDGVGHVVTSIDAAGNVFGTPVTLKKKKQASPGSDVTAVVRLVSCVSCVDFACKHTLVYLAISLASTT